jgi:hypothetical protein
MAYEILQQTIGSGRQYNEASEMVNMADKMQESLGQKGLKVIADTNAAAAGAGKCYTALQMVSDTVLAALVADTTSPIAGTITGITFGAGTIIYGKFTSVTLTSGSLIAYMGLL